MLVKEAKILLYDVEVSPNLGWTWQKYDQNVIAFEKESHLLSFAYKWFGKKEIKCETMQGQKNDKRLALKLHELFQEADILIAHNGNSFDKKKVCARFVYYNLAPTKFLSTIDTKLVAKRYFSFNSNSLDDLAAYLGLERKIRHSGFELWLGCLRDEKEAWAEMAKYNKRDVLVLEQVYLRFRPWIQNHPSVALLDGSGKCPNCGSSNTIRRGVRANSKSLQQQHKCHDCGTWFLGRYNKNAS